MNNKKMRILLIIQIISLILTTIIVGGIIIYYMERKDIPHAVNINSERIQSIQQKADNLESKLESIENTSHMPKKNVDYFDGKDGEKGEKGDTGDPGESIKGDRGTKGDKGEAGEDGLTPLVRCNTEKNRWEVRYNIQNAWEVLNGEVVKCTFKKLNVLGL